MSANRSPDAPRTIAVAGAVAQRHAAGGHVVVFSNYVRGLNRLGYEVVLIDRVETHAAEARERFEHLSGELTPERGTVYTLLGRNGVEAGGLSREDLLERVRRSVALINVMGYLDDEEILEAAPVRVFLDIDPGFPQMWRELGQADVLSGHDAHVTIGQNIGRPGCSIPGCGLTWIAIPPPIVLDRWPVAANGGTAFTSVCTWRGPYDPVDYGGVKYGLRAHEFRKFVQLPELTGEQFELALDIHEGDGRDLALLHEHGWQLADPDAAAGDPQRYRRYLQCSRAEFMVAKGMYVQTRSGWFSDRSICYLASGRPVLAQDTGLSDLYPAGEGLLLFTTLRDAVAGVQEIAGDYVRHSRAARALAERYFDSDVVLSRLLEELDVA